MASSTFTKNIQLSMGVVLILSCLPQPSAPRLAAPITFALCAVVDYPAASEAAPLAVYAGLDSVLNALNITTVRLPESPTILEQHDTEARLEAFKAKLEHRGVLLEISPRFFSQMMGRQRYSIAVRLTYLSPGNSLQRLDFELPVFLSRLGDGPHEAVDAAAEQIAERVGTWLGSKGE